MYPDKRPLAVILKKRHPLNRQNLPLNNPFPPFPNSHLILPFPHCSFGSTTLSKYNKTNSLTLKTFIMKKLTIVSVVIAFFLMTGITNAQNIAISDVSHTADASAVLDVYSTSLGMLVPRLSSAPSSPATGLLYYSTSSNSFFYNAGTSGSPSWTELSYGNLWTTNGTDTYLTNPNDNLLIGTSSNLLGYKLYVHQPGPGLPMTNSRIDGQLEIWNYSDFGGGTHRLLADINDNGGATPNGIIQIYDNGNAGIRLLANGSSFFKGGNVGIGANPGTLLHVIDNNDLIVPQLQIDNPSGLGAGNTSLGFNYVDASGTATDFAQGIYGGTGDFEICNTTGMPSPALVAAAQSDGVTMFRAFPSGIVDLNNQSRARVFQQMNPNINPPNPNVGQFIPFASWTEVNFDIRSYDNQIEWNLATNATSGPSYFKATEDGYYQINARVDFILSYFEQEGGEEIVIHYPNYPGYVSIAVFVSNDNGQTWNMYAQGNKLQGADNNSGWNDLQNNLAPNISDVVELQQNDLLDVRVWQNLGKDQQGNNAPIPLRVLEQNGVGGHSTQVYCSIHKSS
jgi:hypothetical protein